MLHVFRAEDGRSLGVTEGIEENAGNVLTYGSQFVTHVVEMIDDNDER